MKPRRLMSLLVAICMMMTIIPFGTMSAFAANRVTVEDVLYEITDENIAVVTGFGGTTIPTTGKIVIQSQVEKDGKNYTVTKIGDRAFEGKTWLTAVELPNSITSIGYHGFFNTGLTSIVIPQSVTYIGGGAFASCTSLIGNVELTNSKTEIGDFAFSGSNLENLKIGAKIIGGKAFNGCFNLKKVEILNGVEEIGELAFNGCASWEGDLVLPNSITRIDKQAFSYCSKLSGDVSIPNSVTYIGSNTFLGTDIKKLNLPENFGSLTAVNELGMSVFYKGTRSDVEMALTGKTIEGLDKENLKIGNNYICYYCDVNFDTDGGTPTSEAQKNIIRMDKLDTSKINTPSKQGYIFSGWYYVNDAGEAVSFNPATQGVPDSITLTAKWLKHATATIEGFDTTVQQGESKEFTVKVTPNDDTGDALLDFGKDNANIEYKDGDTWTQVPDGGQPIDLNAGEKDYLFRLISVSDASRQTLRVSIHRPNNELGGDDVAFDAVNKNKLTVVGGTVKVNGTAVELNADNSCLVKKDSLVEVTFDKSTLSENQSFDQWTSNSSTVLNAIDPKSETIKFTMPSEKVTLEAMTKNADIDDGSNVLGTAAVIGTVAVGGAVIAWQGYNIAADIYARDILPEGTAIPETKEALAVMLWQNAGKPEVVAADGTALTETEQAQQWVVANGLMENEADGTFHPEKGVGKFAVLNAIKEQSEKVNE